MLNKIISQYLKSHKRLVIPALGTFVVKDGGEQVIFTEMYRRDDGVLSSLLVQSGVPELEAAGVIDRMVFEVRHAVQNGSSYLIEGVGVLRQGENGTIAFSYEPDTVSVAHREEPSAVEEQPAQPAAAPETEAPSAQPVRHEEQPAPAVASPSVAAEERQPSVEEPDAQEQPHSDCCQKQLNTGRIVNTVETAFANEKRRHDDDDDEASLDDLQYRRPYKNTDAYTYVHHTPRKKGNDRFIWLAIAAALIALAAIAFGYWNEMNNVEMNVESFIEDSEMTSDGM